MLTGAGEGAGALLVVGAGALLEVGAGAFEEGGGAGLLELDSSAGEAFAGEAFTGAAEVDVATSAAVLVALSAELLRLVGLCLQRRVLERLLRRAMSA